MSLQAPTPGPSAKLLDAMTIVPTLQTSGHVELVALDSPTHPNRLHPPKLMHEPLQSPEDRHVATADEPAKAQTGVVQAQEQEHKHKPLPKAQPRIVKYRSSLIVECPTAILAHVALEASIAVSYTHLTLPTKA